MKQNRRLRRPAAFLLALIMLFSLSSTALAATSEDEQTPLTVSDPAGQSAPPSASAEPLPDDDPADQSAPPSETPADERTPLPADDPADQSAPPSGTPADERLPLTDDDPAEQSAPPASGDIVRPLPETVDETANDPWAQDQSYSLADPAPWDLDELKRVVDVTDPRSVVAYWVWAVMRLGENYDDGMAMMKYLYADIEAFGPGYTEGGLSGRAGWDTYFNERLKDPDYKWLPRAYFEGADKSNGFALVHPLRIRLFYDKANTEAANATTIAQFGRENYTYRVKSNAGGNEVTITASKFVGSNRWYVTNGGASSTTLFYDQRWALTAAELAMAKATGGDPSTADEHQARYSGEEAGRAPAIVSTGVDPSASGTAHQSTQPVEINGKKVELQAYALKDPETGYDTNYVKIRDVAAALNGTESQFDVTWSDAVNLVATTPYDHPNGQENQTPYSGSQPYAKAAAPTKVNGQVVDIGAFVITDDQGGGSTYYKLRDVGQALGFNVGWSAERGIFIEPGNPYTFDN